MARPVPADLEDALASNPAARERFWSMPPEQKDEWVRWVERARFPGARRRRVHDAVGRLAGGRRATTVVTNGSGPQPVPSETWPVWLAVLAVLAALAGFIVWYTALRDDGKSSNQTVVVAAKATVPKVVGIRWQSAQFQLKEAKLGTKLVRRNATKPKGIVVQQKPEPDASVAQGTPVTLVVSNGPPGVAMPDVVGMAAADAVRALRERRLTATLQQVASQEPPGTVLAQAPKPGKRAAPGTKVMLQVAKGGAAVAVPDLTGRPQQQAVAALQRAGLTARVIGVPSTQQPGTVVAQRPAAGQKVAQGSAVRLNVARAGTATTTPAPTTTATSSTVKPPAHGNDYTGMRLTDAVQKIADGRQQVIVQYVTSTQPAGVVVSNAREGSRERLQVSAGPHPKPGRDVPDVTNQDSATAEQALRSAGFSVLEVRWPVSDQTRDGVVTYQTPSGTQVPQGSTIVIFVGAAGG